MALDNYSSMVTAISANWMHRSDLTAVTDDFIRLFEADFNATVRVRQMEQQTSISSTGGYLIHPSQWREWKQLSYSYGGKLYNLQPVSEEGATIHAGQDSSTTPKFYKVRNNKTYLYPAPSSTAVVAATYYEGVTALSSAQSSNWVIASYPGLYLYGGLEQAIPYVGDDPRVPLWVAARDRALAMLKKESDGAENSHQVLKIRPDIKVP